MQIPEHIFKAYDIRGLVETELSPELAYGIGKAFVAFLKQKGTDMDGKFLVLGYDMRKTSQDYAKRVEQAFLESGVNVRNIGLTSTPVFNFAVAHFEEHVGGIMVTASHNPAQYNGFKITQGDGMPIGKNSGMDEIRRLVVEANWSAVEDSPAQAEAFDAQAPYVERIFSLVSPDTIKPLKVVIDGGNGMAGAVLPHWIKRLPVEVEYLYIEPDGTFPNHEANPIKVETLEDLQKKVVEVGADFGFALDGDADRIGLVDEKGNVVDASFVGALLGQKILESQPGAHMLYDLRSSQIIPEIWEQGGATTEKCMVGHALIKGMMRKVGAVFASELSLHVYFGSMYNMESTDLCLLYFLQMLSESDKSLSQLVAPLSKYVHSGEMNFEVKDKNGVLAVIEQKYSEQALEVSHLDGLWMRFDWGWVSLRQSNTEPVLRLNLETNSKQLTREKGEEFVQIIMSGN
ncbi:phosphomannomutase/phosphoglucomutase [Candidatus Nomurabacteria bacterium]|nr:phosphomannomutase/phosphoglucomutase [Candidatus Nomurabacteria bacterium]